MSDHQTKREEERKRESHSHKNQRTRNFERKRLEAIARWEEKYKK